MNKNSYIFAKIVIVYVKRNSAMKNVSMIDLDVKHIFEL